MNREEAIAILQAEFDKSCGDYSFQNPAKLDREDALWTAISALRPVSREQVEKAWRGKWKRYLPPLGAGAGKWSGEMPVLWNVR